MATGGPPTEHIPAGALFYRLHRQDLGGFWFGNKDRTWRYDDPAGIYGVMYLGRSKEAALAEVLMRDPSQGYVMWSDAATRRLATFCCCDSLALAMVHGAGLAYHGVQQADVVASDYAVPQHISANVHALPDFDGLQYRSRFDSDELCIALFDRAASKIELLSEGEQLDRGCVRAFLQARGKQLADL